MVEVKRKLGSLVSTQYSVLSDDWSRILWLSCVTAGLMPPMWRVVPILRLPTSGMQPSLHESRPSNACARRRGESSGR